MENCKGKNCAIAGENKHSLECMFEHFISYTGEDIDADNALIAKLRKAYFDGAATTESELEALKRERAMLVEFKADQWWVDELDAMCERHQLTDDEKRAIAVVHNLLRTLSATEQQSKQWLLWKQAEALGHAADHESLYDKRDIIRGLASELRSQPIKDKE